tara:strand:+ start:1036 stop:1263 length:228 start_codon:yes stop_codon:yes gene_type:complete
MQTQQLIDMVTGQFGALVLAVLLLLIIMRHYKSLIDQSLTEHREDRALYRDSMLTLVSKMDQIGRDIDDIKQRIT